MKFLDIFNPIEKGVHGLTDEAIYHSINNRGVLVPLYGGNNQHVTTSRYVNDTATNVDGKPIKIFTGVGIIISLDGSAGAMTYKQNERFVLNHHAGFITLKKDALNQVNLIYFSIFMENHFKSLSVSDGSKTLSLDQVYSTEFDLPDYQTQCEIISNIRSIIKLKDSLLKIKNRFVDLVGRKVDYSYNSFQKRGVRISNAIKCLSGNSGLTEESIYNNIDTSKKLYHILSSATVDSNMFGKTSQFDIKGKPIKVFEYKEGLLVIRNGMAGKTFYLEPGNYTLNDHAYILYPNPSCPYKINLKWLSIEYRDEFLSFTSTADNGTWNKTGFFSNTVIDIPSVEEQNKVIKEHLFIEQKINDIETILKSINNLLSKEIISLKG